MRLLIIDDSRTMRRLLCAIVAPLPAETIEAENGQQGLEQLQANWPVDLALVDWDMPVMCGLDFVKAVRADSRFDGMKVLMVTARNSMDAVSQAIEAGASDFLMKPLTEAMVVEKVRMLGLVE